MNFKYSYENGYSEARNALSEDVKAYILGYERAYDDIETFMANTDCYESISHNVSPTLAKIDRELRENIINDLRDWLRSNWYEMVVSFIDDAGGDDNTGKLKQCWRLPEPMSEERLKEQDWEEF